MGKGPPRRTPSRWAAARRATGPSLIPRDGRPAGGDSVRDSRAPRRMPSRAFRHARAPPSSARARPRPAGAQGASPKRPEPEGEIESPLNRVTKREDNLSGKRFGRESSEYFTRREVRFARPRGVRALKAAPPNPTTASARRAWISPSASPRRAPRRLSPAASSTARATAIEMAARRARRGARMDGAILPRQEREVLRPGPGSRLRDRMTEGYKALTQVSMQDINKFQFRRSHSTVKGELPVGRIGAEGTTPMRPEALPNR